MSTVKDLPVEVLEHILYFIDPYIDLKSCSLVCRRWHSCCVRVVARRKGRFIESLQSGVIECKALSLPCHVTAVTHRYSHSACIHNSSMFVFGGCTSTNTTFNDLWKFDLGTHKWVRLLTIGTYPSPKAYASMVTWGDSLILFGGWTHPSVFPLHQQWVLFNELHIYDILANRWTQLYFPGSPPPTAGHTTTVHGSYVVVIGGLQKHEATSGSTNDIYCLDLEGQAWFKPVITSLMPLPRYGHSQIKVDEHHILLIAGCGGSNKLYSDIWLLTLPENIGDRSAEWAWKEIRVTNHDLAPSQMWYIPACKVEESVVFLSSGRAGSNGGNMNQLLIPGIIRKQSQGIWVPPVQAPVSGPCQPRVDSNANCQRGALRNRNTGVSSHEVNREDPETGVHVKIRLRPSIRPNASSDRDKRLQILSRMEERLRYMYKPSESAGPSKAQTGVASQGSSSYCIVPHMLDISQVVERGEVSWLPLTSKTGTSQCFGNAPQPSRLYSLLLGRGHLIMFGGTPNDPLGHSPESVSNTVTLICAPL